VIPLVPATTAREPDQWNGDTRAHRR
jgi:hypothetical protein